MMLKIRTLLLIVPIIIALSVADSNNHLALIVGSTLSVLIYLYLLIDLLERGEGFRFYFAAALFCAFWTTLGVLQSASSMSTLGLSSFPDLFSINSLWFSIDVRDYALASAYLYSFVLACYFFSRLKLVVKAENCFRAGILPCLTSVSLNVWSFWTLALSITLWIISFLGIFSVRGIAVDFEFGPGGTAWWFPFLFLLISLLPFPVTRLIASIKNPFSPHSLIAVFGLLTSIYLAAVNGRRAILFTMATLLYSWFLFESPTHFFRRIGSKKLVILIIIAFVFLPFALKLIDFTQFIRSEAGFSSDPLSYINQFLEFIQSDVVDEASEISEENLAFRPLILWPLAASIKMSLLGINNGYIGFQDIVNSFLNALPRPLYPFKANLILQEGLLYTYFPFSDVDTADSPHLYAFTSFGLFGLIVYPLFLLVIYLLFLAILQSSFPRAYPLPVIILTISTLLSFAVPSYAESSTSGIIRKLLLPAIFLLAWKSVRFISSSGDISRSAPSRS